MSTFFSLLPQDASEGGGLLRDVDVEITGAAAKNVLFGSTPTNALVLKLKTLDGAQEEDLILSMGKDATPSPDGVAFLGQPNKNSNGILFIASVINKPGAEVLTPALKVGNVTCLVGLKFHLKRVPQSQFRQGMAPLIDTATGKPKQESTVAQCDKVIAWPGGAAVVAAAAPVASRRRGAAAAAAPAAAAPAAPAPAPAPAPVAASPTATIVDLFSTDEAAAILEAVAGLIQSMGGTFPAKPTIPVKVRMKTTAGSSEAGNALTTLMTAPAGPERGAVLAELGFVQNADGSVSNAA